MTGRRLTIGRSPRALEAVLTEPPGPRRGAAVVCHPHPQMGGDMDNAVVVTVGGALARLGLAVLRFNFGGVGRSEGGYGGGPAEVADVGVALGALETDGPRVLAGYSFGAWAALRAVAAGAAVAHVVAVGPPLGFLDWAFLAGVRTPVTLVAGGRDRFCPADRLASLAAPAHRIVTIRAADHFFGGAEEHLAAAVADAVRAVVAAP